MYEIRFAESVKKELADLSAYERARILHEIEEQLSHEPTVETRNRKFLEGVEPSFEAVPPVWELRVAQYRVFYDVDLEGRVTYIRAVRRKPPHKTTGGIV